MVLELENHMKIGSNYLGLFKASRCDLHWLKPKKISIFVDQEREAHRLEMMCLPPAMSPCGSCRAPAILICRHYQPLLTECAWHTEALLGDKYVDCEGWNLEAV